MVFEENLEGFAGDLPVEQEVFVVQDEEDGGSAGLKVFQVASLDAKSTVAAIVFGEEGVVVYLLKLVVC